MRRLTLMESKIFFVIVLVLTISWASLILVVATRGSCPSVKPLRFEVAYTGSMYPYFKGGEIVNGTDNFTARVGDVIVYEDHKGDYIVHRLLCINNDTYFLKGDNNTGVDRPVNKSQLRWKIK